ncbi:MAG: MCE family protein [Gemmatimonadota bacterium]|nr:MAG: MCE family protein [Gemmatimonadota bacterium]
MNAGSKLSWTQVRVGMAVTVALIVLAVSVFFIGETGAIFGERYRLITLMPSASGLIEGAGVRLAGQDVGKVDVIEFVPIAERGDPNHILRIELAIDLRVRDLIRGDSEARIRTQGLLGDKIIDVTPGTPDAPALEEGDTLQSAVAIDYEQMIASAAELVEDVSSILNNLRALADSMLAGRGTAGRLLMDTTLYIELLQTSRTLNEFLTAVGRGEGALAQLAQDTALYADLRSMVAGLDSLTLALTSGESTLSRLLTDDSLYLALTSSSARADSLLASLESGEGTMGQLLTDQELYDSLLKLLVDVQVVIEELRADPRKYVPPIKVF